MPPLSYRLDISTDKILYNTREGHMKKYLSDLSRFFSVHQLALIFFTALLARSLVFIYVASDVRKFYTFDSSEYVTLAQNLLDHGTFSQENTPPFSPDLARTPGYPVFLAIVLKAFGNNFHAIILLQIIIGGITAVLTYYLAVKLGHPTSACLIAAWIVTLDPVAVLLSNRLLTETLFTFGLVLAVLLLTIYLQNNKIEFLILSAIVVSFSALTRPIVQFLPIALLPLLIVARKDKRLSSRVSSGLTFVFICGAIISSWSYRNYKTGNLFMLSTIADTNLIYYRARAVLAEAEHISQEDALKELQDEIETAAAQQNLSQPEIFSLQRKKAFQIFSQYPVQTSVMLVKGAGRMLVDPGFTIICTMLDRSSLQYDCIPGQSTMLDSGVLTKVSQAFQKMTLVQQSTLLWGIIFIGVIYIGLAGGISRLVREKNWLSLFLLGIVILYFVALSAGGETNYRFRAPILPFIAILSGAGYNAILRYIGSVPVKRERSIP